MKLYTSGSKNASGGGGGSSYGSGLTDPYGFEVGGTSLPSSPDEPEDAGKGSFSFADPIGSIGDTIGNFGDFLGGIGQIGIPGGPNLGGIAGVATAPVRFGLEAAGNALGAVGSIPLPYLGNDPTKTNATVGDIPGAMLGVIGAPARFVEEQAAKGRLTGNDAGTDILAEVGRAFFGSQTDRVRGMIGKLREAGEPVPPALIAELARLEAQNEAALPPDIQDRLDAGESVDALAAEMADRGIGFNNDPGANLAASLALDPLNFLAPGAGKALRGAKEASRALAAGELLGVGSLFMGKAYGAAARGLSAGGQVFMDRAIGPVTSGVFHALGTKSYNALTNGAADLNPEYGQRFVDAFAIGSGQLPRAVLAKQMADDVAQDIRRRGQAALAGLDDAEASLEARAMAQRTINLDEFERSAEELLLRVAPDFAGRDAASIAEETVRKYAAITGMSVEDAARLLGSKASDLQTARTVHLGAYGKAIEDFGPARAAAATAKNIDVERLTLVGPENLTTERAAAVLAGGADELSDAVEKYTVLADRFAGTAYDHAAVRAFIQKLLDEDALTAAVRLPITGKNALPPSLGAWRAKYADLGYELGFMPKGGIKTIIDDAGDVIYAEPFIGVTTEVDPLTMRNPLGRFLDGLFRGITQTAIIQDSRARFVAVTRDAGISPGEARGLHKVIIEEARRQGTTPRGLDNYADLFSRYLGPERYAKLAAKHNPAFLVMKAFEGNLARVGLTQKITGKAKTAAAERGNMAAQIAEKVYPLIKFRLSPLFQLQELVESRVWNALRGVLPQPASPEIAKLYDELAELPEVRHFTEAGYFLHLWGSESVTRAMGTDTVLGKALARVPDVAASKNQREAAQIAFEHGPAFEEAVNTINPKLWRVMTKAYGTTDARAVARAFVTERFDLQDPRKALAAFDAAMPRTFASADEETVWQAFRESLRQVSEQAFKTHFFNARRGWLERSLNHPYLGLYPASYMWGKVLPEFARFLLLRPFGLNAPLVGAAAYGHVQEALAARLAGDPDFAQAVEDNEDLIYGFATLMPALPNDLPANAPAWARHLSNDLTDLQGNPRYKSGPRKGQPKQFDPLAFADRETRDAAAYAFGPARTVSVAAGALGDLGDLTGDLFADLTRAAEQLDVQYPRVTVP